MENLHVIWRRKPCGAVESLEIHQGLTLLHDTAAEPDPCEALEWLLKAARDYCDADPFTDHLPPDDAVVAAYEEYVS